MKNLSSGPLAKLPLDASPSILIPHFDEDLNVLFLSGKGDRTILPIDVNPQLEKPLFSLPRFESPGGTIQQGVSFIAKTKLDVSNVEVARCWRLTQTAIEPISFTVPRNRKEYFQDDLFPLTRDWECATMNVQEWLKTENPSTPKRVVDLKPVGMTKLSQAPPEKKISVSTPKSSFHEVVTDSQRQQKVRVYSFERKVTYLVS